MQPFSSLNMNILLCCLVIISVNNEIMSINKEIDRLTARVAVIEQKCDLILARIKTLQTSRDIDGQIERMHRQARAMRKHLRR